MIVEVSKTTEIDNKKIGEYLFYSALESAFYRNIKDILIKKFNIDNNSAERAIDNMTHEDVLEILEEIIKFFKEYY
jgi:hypothetical protein